MRTSLLFILTAALAVVLGLPGSAAAIAVDGATLYGNHTGGQAGTSVASAGDVNGDGIQDVIVGSPLVSTTDLPPARTQNGEATVIFGPIGAHEVISVNNPGTRGFRIVGDDWYHAKDHLGSAVAGIGDINGDGYDDVAAMATDGASANAAATEKGYAAVVYGGPSPTTVDLKNPIAQRGFLTYLPSDAYARNYVSVSPAGDVNGDGLDDFMFADPEYYDASVGSCTQCADGDVYVVYGHGANPGPLEAEALNGLGYRIVGGGHQHFLGRGLAPAGDLNGDGIDDLLLGEPGCFVNTAPCGDGAAYVIYGTKSSPDSFHVPPNHTSGFAVTGPTIGGGLGTSVAAPGDVNGDGRVDLVLGMPFADSQRGRAYVFFKPADPPATTGLSDPGVTAALIQGDAAGDAFGSVVAPAGDVDGDGLADVAISAPNTGPNARGAVYVLRSLHAPSVLNLTLGLAPADGYELLGATPSHLGTSFDDLGDVDGDGRSDFILGAPTADPPFIADAGIAVAQFAAPLPSVVTGAAQGITTAAATVAAKVNASSQATTVRIDYSAPGGAGIQSPSVDGGSAATAVAVTVPLAGLAAATTYTYRAVAVNASGTVFGKRSTFTTADAPAVPGPGIVGAGGGAPGSGGPTGPLVIPPAKDAVPPVALFETIICHAKAKATCRRALGVRKNWRTLRGTVADPAPSSGVSRVEVAATTRPGKRCRALSTHGFAKTSCKTGAVYVAAKLQGSTWSLALTGLPRGTIKLAVRAVDAAGNVQPKPTTRTLHLLG